MEKRPTAVSSHALRSEGIPASFRTFVAVALVGWLAGCGGDSTSGPDPDDNKVSSVSVTPGTNSLSFVGETAQLSAAAKNASGNPVGGTTYQWSTSSSTVAAVSGTGLVTAIGNGTATITAMATGSTISGTAQVTVQQAVAEVTVSPQDGSIEVGATVQLSATATDAGGADVESATFTWASSDDAVATVSSNGLVTGVAGGPVTITATSGGTSGNAPVTVVRPDLEITVDTNLEGTVEVDEFKVPAGVTVTVTDDLSIDATGYVEVLGTLIGDCVDLSIQGDTAITVMGTLNNGCAAGVEGEDLTVIADGELTLEDATLISSGDMEFSNDPTLTDGDFPESGPGGVAGTPNAGRDGDRPSRAGRGVPFTRVNRTTVRYSGGETGPWPADPGMDNGSGDGGDGKSGRRVRFRLRGNAEFVGETLLWGQDAGWGGNGTKSGTSDVEVKGGKGGTGGDIRVWVTGTLTYSGAENTIRSGRGGAGGDATATGEANSDPPKAPSATATGGLGGDPGLIDMRAGGGITVANAGALIFEIGYTGDGGNATAKGADGANGTAEKAPQEGGDATATGGAGGGTPDKQLRRSGVSGPDPIIRGSTGSELKGGRGGYALATAGKGGDGEKPNKDGAPAGAFNAQGGKGGDYKLKKRNGNLLGNGGDGGDATFKGGRGGNGWDDCKPGEPVEAGGAGGKGGDATGGHGVKGTGLADGTDGSVTYDNAGNGGDGMRESGAKGPAGDPTAVTGNATAVKVGTNFTDGAEGGTCPVPDPPKNTYIDQASTPNTSGQVGFGAYLLDLYNFIGQVVGSITVETWGSPNNHFTAPNPPRWGWFGLDNGWDILLDEITVDGQLAVATEVEVCLLNTTVDGANPAILEQLDALGQVIDTEVWTTLAAPPQGGPVLSPEGGSNCRARSIKAGARRVRMRGPGGRFADGGGPPGRRGIRVRVVKVNPGG